MSRDCTALVALAGLAPDRRLRVASVLASPLQLQTIAGARSRFGSLSLASPRSLAVTHETPEIGSWQAPDPTLIKKREALSNGCRSKRRTARKVTALTVKEKRVEEVAPVAAWREVAQSKPEPTK